MNLGKLKKVELREIWKHEAIDFTKWLAKEENINELSNEIGIDIEVLQTEANVGSFNVDILAKERDTDRKIILENQLEKTDHDHLGKLITYASGYSAEVIIWIVKSAREEHQNAIEWLNENMNENISFFLIEIELWQIGNSEPAPKFQIISKPNDWAKVIKTASEKGELTNTKSLQLEFWEAFNDFAEGKVSFNLRKPKGRHWYDISYGDSNSHLSVAMDTRNNIVNIMLYIPDNIELFSELSKRKQEIIEELGFEMEWQDLENKKARRINYSIENFKINEKESWNIYYALIIEKVEKIRKIFIKYVK